MKKHRTLIKTTILCALSTTLHNCKQHDITLPKKLSNIYLNGNTFSNANNNNDNCQMPTSATPVDKDEYFYNKNLKKSFICSITQDIMQDPVIAADGHSYERIAIEQ